MAVLFGTLCGGALWLGPAALALWWMRRDGAALRREMGELRAAQERLRRSVARLAADGSDTSSPPTAAVKTAPPKTSTPEPDPGEPSAPAGTPPPTSPVAERPETAPVPAPTRPAPAPLPVTLPSARRGTEGRDRPPGRPSLEERLGARLPVWLGSIALALAGIYLVRFSIDQGWITETTRVVLGTLLGVALLAFGEAMGGRSDRIAAGLSAAGVATLYAAFLAASELYGLVSSEVGFGLTALVTATAVGLSLRRGPIVALVGLVGGFLTPRLLRGDPSPQALPLLAYLLLLQAGLLAVATRRAWSWLAAATLVPALAWVLPWLPGVRDLGAAPWLHVYLLATLGIFVASAWRSAASPEAASTTEGGSSLDDLPLPLLLSWLAAAGAILLSTRVASASGYTTMDWAFLGLLAAGTIVVGRRLPGSAGLPWMAALFVALALLDWGAGDLSQVIGKGAIDPESLLSSTVPVPASTGRVLATVALLGALFSVGAYAALWGDRRPWQWAALCASSAVGYLLVAGANTWEHLPEGPLGLPWGLWILAVGATLVAVVLPVARRRAGGEGVDVGDGPGARAWDRALAALAAGATACAALAVPAELERQWITVAWALQVAALAWLARRLRVPTLRALAWPLAGLVFLRLLLNPAVVESYPTGELPILNWLLYGYGLPLLAFAFAAWHSRAEGDVRLSRCLEVGTVLLGAALLTLQIVHLFGRGELAHDWPWLEFATVPVAWAAYGLLLRRLDRALPRGALRWGGLLIGLAGLATAAFLQLGPLNPVWYPAEVGRLPVLNALLLSVGAPALLAFALWRDLASSPDFRGRNLLLTGLGISVIGLLFGLLNLEVRQAFQGSSLYGTDAANAELYAYSVSWGLFGMALLAVGVVRRSLLARRASLAIFVLAVGKVFLYDMRQLNDLYRVLSFLGLGLSLLALSWVYQRFVVGEEEEAR